MILHTTLMPSGGVIDYLPTTIGYKRRMAKQVKKLEVQRRLHEARMEEIRREKEHEAYLKKRDAEMEKLRRDNPQKYQQLQHQQMLQQLQQLQNQAYNTRLTGIYY